MVQSKLKVITRGWHKTREKKCKLVTIGFGFISDWIRKWRVIFQPIVWCQICLVLTIFSRLLYTGFHSFWRITNPSDLNYRLGLLPCLLVQNILTELAYGNAFSVFNNYLDASRRIVNSVMFPVTLWVLNTMSNCFCTEQQINNRNIFILFTS